MGSRGISCCLSFSGINGGGHRHGRRAEHGSRHQRVGSSAGAAPQDGLQTEDETPADAASAEHSPADAALAALPQGRMPAGSAHPAYDSQQADAGQRVYDSQRVCAGQRVYDSQRVCAELRVYDSQRVCAGQRVYDSPQVYAEPQVRDAQREHAGGEQHGTACAPDGARGDNASARSRGAHGADNASAHDTRGPVPSPAPDRPP